MANSFVASESGAIRIKRIHRLQRWLGWAVAPLWVPAASFWLTQRLSYKIVELKETRRLYRRIREESDAPLLICANHLTLIDSFLIGLALSGGFRYLIDFDSLPWNIPEESNFANTRLNRVLAYLGKCIPIRRGGSREDVADVLKRVTYLLGKGEAALVFPEGGRSRAGRIEASSAGWGVGRIVSGLEGCRVLCVYLRGDEQRTFSDWPVRGERFHVSTACIEPKSDARGVRGTRDIANQIVSTLANLESEYFLCHGEAPAIANTGEQN
ncbi:MAG: lysophospholipid acyltransferase family protein [Myxococcota bacterium]|nr:lysophospholipid acyltransferase family protein [Myxococcota bacterium]